MAKTRPKVRKAKSKSPTPQSSARDFSSAASSPASDIRLKGLICVLLIVVTLVAYWQVLGCQFITSYDDQDYVTRNPFVSKGLSPGSLRWAFTTFRCSNWHPLTCISHMADRQVYGLDPRGHHLTNLLFHIANALILFLVLSRMTGAVWKSGFVAALFAVHPMHVESVAWVAERKDVLSTFFWLITMYAYILYAKRPSIARYAPVIVAFGLGLMCKPMLVSLPLVLLLLDYWPLDRMNLRWRLVWEKAPLFVMSAAASIVTVIAQGSGGSLAGLGWLSMGFRVENAAISYVAYAVKMVWPSGLSVFYPLNPASLPIWQAVGAILVLASVTVLVLRCGRRWPYVAVGWLWYLITLMPVIGLVQVGWQAMADRYSYITLTGLFIIIAWGIPDLLARRNTTLRRLLPASAVALIVILGACTWFQVAVWRDSYSLFDNAVKVTKDNCLAYNNRGSALVQQGRHEEAINDFSRAIEIQPSYADAHSNLGFSLIAIGQVNQGIGQLLTALRLGFDTPATHSNLAYGYYRLGRFDLATRECLITLRLDPAYSIAHNTLAAILGQQGKLDEAIMHMKSAAELDPDYAEPHGNLATAYFSKGDYVAAWREIHIFESKGGNPAPQFIADLTKRMPDPGE
jgi:protein O-mannosyl-transferase